VKPAPAVSLPPTLRVFERGWLSSNNVLMFDDARTATLVDSGYASHAEQTLALVDAALHGRRLVRLVNTHLHSDHCGGNAALKRRFGVSIMIPPGQAAAVQAWDEAQLTYAATGQQCAPFRYDALLQPGTVLRMGGADWLAIGAPGHDPHSVMLWNERDGVLISADVLWEHGFGAIFPEIEGDSGFSEQRAMLDRIAELRPRVVIPGHGAPFTGVGDALARAHARLAALAADPARNARHVAKVLVKFYLLEVREIGLPALRDHFSQARYFRILHERYFNDRPLAAIIDRAVQELAATHAAELDGERVRNRD
jgi:glyoxylase-like metal-dependent hydrolase (beta-lactamase superfamily II)